MLYTKLYNKYSKLKKEKDANIEKLNRDQEVKFLDYVTAAEEMIEYLRSENDRLGKENSDLRSELSSISSTKDEKCIQYQRLLMEENQKNRKLAEEVERLRKGEKVDCGPQITPTSSKAGPSSNSMVRMTNEHARKVDSGSQNTPSSKAGPSSNSITVRMTRKRARESKSVENRTIATKEVMPAQLSDTGNRSHDTSTTSRLPPCCIRKISDSGHDATTETISGSCKFQNLIECVVGMQLCTVPENDEFSISVRHPSSGYSFSLTWAKSSSGEPEFLYRLLSLGTFERVAPEWMRDILIFSPRMCPVFFERVSRVIKLQH